MLEVFDALRFDDDGFHMTLGEELRQAVNWDQRLSALKAKELQGELVTVRKQQDRLLNLRILD